MGDAEAGSDAMGASGSDDGGADSPAKAGFLTRLFRREGAGVDTDGSSETHDTTGSHAGSSEMILNVRRIRGMRVEDVSVPRAEIIAVSDEAALEDVVAIFQQSSMTRLPVYDGSLDQPLGLVHLKDLALRYGFGAGEGPFNLRDILRPLIYVPPSMPIGVLLQKMQVGRIHMALVIDEYGGVDGLVTIEDLLEQIVGEIGDEHDEEDDLFWSREGEDVYLAQARMDIEDFETQVGLKLADAELAEEVDTLGGLVIRLAGRVPARAEVVPHPDGHEFEVLDADARKVKRLRVRICRPGAAAGAEAAE